MAGKSKLLGAMKIVKLVILGSALATRTATGSYTVEDQIANELAWLNVRRDLETMQQPSQLPTTIVRLVAAGQGPEFETRILASYAAVRPEARSQLDAMWMDRLADEASSATLDRFLATRAVALAEAMGIESDSLESADDWVMLANNGNGNGNGNYDNENNGWGNGDQDAPGGSGDNNNAENSDNTPPPGQQP